MKKNVFFLFVISFYQPLNCWKRLQLNSHDYKKLKTFTYNGPEHICLTKNDLQNVAVLHHNTNPMMGYIAIPIQFRSDKKHVKGTYLGTGDAKETLYPHAFIPE